MLKGYLYTVIFFTHHFKPYIKVALLLTLNYFFTTVKNKFRKAISFNEQDI